MRIKILTVSEATTYIQRLFKADPILGHISVQGEVSNAKLHSSGTVYFTLKDEQAKIPCVCFKQQLDEIGLIPEDGMHLVIKGAISLYEKEGRYQLYVKSMEAAGTGDLYQRFEALKKELQLLGYFETARKRPFTRQPRRIGIVTSPTGAAIQDMLSVFRRKNPTAEIIILPSPVQGNGAAEQLAAAIEKAQTMQIDVLLLSRGGGSIEELWAFNERVLADAIFRSQIPIITGVGHETDFTIADFVSDFRAPTPTAAADAVCTSRQELREILDQAYDTLVFQMQNKLDMRRHQLEAFKLSNQLEALSTNIRHKNELLTYTWNHLKMAIDQRFSRSRNQLELAGTALSGSSPLLPLKKGYALVYAKTGVLAPDAILTPGEEIQLKRLSRTTTCRVLEERDHDDTPEL